MGKVLAETLCEGILCSSKELILAKKMNGNITKVTRKEAMEALTYSDEKTKAEGFWFLPLTENMNYIEQV